MNDDRRTEIEAFEKAMASGLRRDAQSFHQAIAAAEDLVGDADAHRAGTFQRIDGLLAFAAEAAPARRESQYVAVLRVKALLALRDTSPLPDGEALESIWQAFRLNHDNDEPLYRAFTGFAFAFLAFDAIGIDAGDFPLQRAEDALTAAHEIYSAKPERTGSAAAAYMLAQVELRLVRAGACAGAAAVEKHARAGALIAEAMAPSQSLTAHEWARRSEIAADILMADPGGTNPDTIGAAIRRLDEAQRRYREAKEPELASRCGFAIAELVEKLGPSITVLSAALLEDALHTLEWVFRGSSGDAIEVPTGQMQAAQAWLLAAGNASGQEQTDAYRKAAHYARLLTGAEGLADDLRALGWFLLGNALGGSLLQNPSFAVSDITATETQKTDLADAVAALERARDLFDFAGGGIMSVRSRVQLAKAISAQTFGCGQGDRLEACKFAWHEAVAFAEGDDLARCRLNLVSVLLGSARAENPDGLEIAGRILLGLLRDRAAWRQYRTIIEQNMALHDAIRMQWRQAEANSNYSKAIALAKNADGRRSYLAQTARDGQRSSAGEAAIRMTLLNNIMELRGMRNAGVPGTNATLWHEALASTARDRAIIEDLVVRARREHSSAAGIAVLDAHLRTDAPFILQLRSFGIEMRNIPGPPEAGSYAESDYLKLIGGRQSGWRTHSMSMHMLGDALGQLCPTLLIVNREDPFSSPAVAKLFEPPYEWRKLVFSLIAEANAIVAGIPADLDEVTGGLSDELHAISELGALGRTVLVLEARAGTPKRGAPNNARSSMLRSHLRDRGFAHVFSLGEKDEGLAVITAAVQAVLLPNPRG